MRVLMAQQICKQRWIHTYIDNNIARSMDVKYGAERTRSTCIPSGSRGCVRARVRELEEIHVSLSWESVRVCFTVWECPLSTHLSTRCLYMASWEPEISWKCQRGQTPKVPTKHPNRTPLVPLDYPWVRLNTPWYPSSIPLVPLCEPSWYHFCTP